MYLKNWQISANNLFAVFSVKSRLFFFHGISFSKKVNKIYLVMVMVKMWLWPFIVSQRFANGSYAACILMVIMGSSEEE